MSVEIRRPSVAGSFYNRSPEDLRKQVRGCFVHPLGPGTVPAMPGSGHRLLGLVCPHAGLVYSGPVAAHSYYALSRDARPEVMVILGPNHYAVGAPVAISPSQAWETPLGRLEVAKELGEALVSSWPGLRWDATAHGFEHSIEVQLPFLQTVYPDPPPILPIALADQSVETCQRLAESLASVFGQLPAVLVATSDMTHYLAHEDALRQDRMALEPLVQGDGRGFLKRVEGMGLNLCGPGPIATLLLLAEALGGAKVTLLKHGTSGETGGGYARVVGYAALAVERISPT